MDEDEVIGLPSCNAEKSVSVYFVKTRWKDLVIDFEINMLLIALARSPVFAASDPPIR